MTSLKLATATLALALVAAPAAMAQSTTPDQTTPKTTPPAAMPAPSTSPQASPSTTPSSPSAPKLDTATLLGKDVFSSDQSRLGKVERVITGSDGMSQSIVIKSGGFLGFGGKMVAIPQSKFMMRGDSIQLQMSADEVSKLPEVHEQG